MRIRPLRLLILLLVSAALPLSACGKKGKPQPPGKVEAEKAATENAETRDTDNQEETE